LQGPTRKNTTREEQLIAERSHAYNLPPGLGELLVEAVWDMLVERITQYSGMDRTPTVRREEAE
jgi:hypothetical protein